MEDILASIKKVIAEEKVMRTPAPPAETAAPEELPSDDVLELDEPLAPPIDLGPPLLDEAAAGISRDALVQLQSVASAAPPAALTNPLEEMVRDMLRPLLKQWLDEHLPTMVDDHVKREIARITGRPL